MKHLPFIRFFAIIAVSAFILTSIANAEDTKEVKIKTSATCGHCKSKIETRLNDLDGVVSSELNLEDKYVTVKYNPTLTNPDEIRNTISNVGYDADNVKAMKAGCCTSSKSKCKDKSPKCLEKHPGCNKSNTDGNK